jgi:hypothetical protein
LDDNPLNLVVANLARRTRPGFIIQAFQTSLQKTGAPFPDHTFRAAKFLCRGLIVQTFGTGQHHAGTPGEERLAARAVRHRFQPRSFLLAQYQGLLGASSPHPRPPKTLDDGTTHLVHIFL